MSSIAGNISRIAAAPKTGMSKRSRDPVSDMARGINHR